MGGVVDLEFDGAINAYCSVVTACVKMLGSLIMPGEANV